MLPFRLVYHEEYDLHLGDHVFPSKKYKWLHDRLIRTRFAAPEDFVSPQPASVEDLLLAHDTEWVVKLKSGVLTYQDILRLEIPYSRQMARAFYLATGGTILAAQLALQSGVGFNAGGGFHHAFPDHGNGPAAIFAGDFSVFTLSIHQFNNYPSEKPPSSLDIHLADGVGDSEYIHRLENGYHAALATFKPDLVLYVAGADPYCEDQLGGLALTFDGLKERDRLVIWGALHRGIPVAIVLAGGYAQSGENTITIHANTASVAKEVLEKTGPWGGPFGPR